MCWIFVDFNNFFDTVFMYTWPRMGKMYRGQTRDFGPLRPWAGFTRNTMGGPPQRPRDWTDQHEDSLAEGAGPHYPQQLRGTPLPAPCRRCGSLDPSTARAGEMRTSHSKCAGGRSCPTFPAFHCFGSQWTALAQVAVTSLARCVGQKESGSIKSDTGQHLQFLQCFSKLLISNFVICICHLRSSFLTSLYPWLSKNIVHQKSRGPRNPPKITEKSTKKSLRNSQIIL